MKQGQKFNGGKSWENKPRGTSPRDDKPRSSAPREDKPWGDKPRSSAPREDKPWGDKPRSSAPRADKPWGDKPRSSAPRADKPWENKPRSATPREPRQWEGKPGDTPSEEAKPWENRTRSPKPGAGKYDKFKPRVSYPVRVQPKKAVKFVAKPGEVGIQADGKMLPESTDWQDVAGWYNNLVGVNGSEYHQRVLLPGVERLLKEKRISTR